MSAIKEKQDASIKDYKYLFKTSGDYVRAHKKGHVIFAALRFFDISRPFWKVK
jgi:hypothetical protein